MSSQIKNSVVVELHDLTLTERTDDRFGRVVNVKSLSHDDLVQKVVARRTDLSPTLMKAAIEQLTQVAIEELCNGATIKFGFAHASLTVNGVFYGDNAQWNPAEHSLSVSLQPTAELREAVAATSVQVRGMASTGLFINQVTDVASGMVNQKLTPGGGVVVSGQKLRIAGSDPAVGLMIVNTQTQAEVVVPPTSWLQNDPSRISFIVPADIPDGVYRLKITTQFASNGLELKESRVAISGYDLIVAR